jgi:hypothetical protein
MNIFPDDVLRMAAEWLSDQERDPAYPDRPTIARERFLLRETTLRKLQKIASEPPVRDADKWDAYIGMSVFAGRGPDGPKFATVNILSDRVFGYLDREYRATFIWPPEVAAKLRAKWAAEDVR